MSSVRWSISKLLTLTEQTNNGLGSSQNPRSKNPTNTKQNGQSKWKKSGRNKTMVVSAKQKLQTKRSIQITSNKGSKDRSKSGRKWRMRGKGNKNKASINEKSLVGTTSDRQSLRHPLRTQVIQNTRRLKSHSIIIQ